MESAERNGLSRAKHSQHQHIDLLDYTLLPYEAHIPEPRGLELFIKGLAEIGINKTLIEN